MRNDDSSPKVVVAVLTYRRPGDLAEVVPMLVAEAATIDVRAEVLVVDNDPAGGAADQVAAMASDALRYVHEPTPGIAAARNRAIRESAGADFLVFIDDDERPTDGWLRTLLACARDTGAAAVAGPVISTFSIEPDEWVRAGRFFDRRRLPTGTVVSLVATNNLIIDRRQLEAMGVTFDERFGLSGGSDTLFSRQVSQRGGTLVWCDEAVVHDVVPPQRLTRAWVLQRARRLGNSWVTTSLAAAPSPAARARVRVSHGARGVLRLGGGGARYVSGVVTRDMSARARGIRTCARGWGLLAGSVGVVFSEYKRKEGSS
ncbi:glycosyltransferase family 2 protein [Planctomonas deserti]|jgi:succinoglycan biosynthesis protein ExoM|uniref:glycosyltransferase family 2 protein n=1 Tax=Planctomonas deserti TaxID=2144185 RepID=UPI000D3B50A9|nr:glycosyltransferase [Planctomonas deserti]